MKYKTVPLMIMAACLPITAQAQLFSDCTDKTLAEWTFDTKTINPDYVDSAVNVTMNPVGVPNNGVGFGNGPGGASDFVACFPNFNVDGYIDFGIESKSCFNFGGLTFDYLNETRNDGQLHGPEVLNFTIYEAATNEVLFQTNYFDASTTTWKHFDINDATTYNGVNVYNTNGWENLIAGEGLRFEIGGWYGNTWETGLDINNLKITGCDCVPEPGSITLAGLAGLTLLLRRRR